jgi:hypothetical protein
MPAKKLTLSEKIFAITQRCSAIERNGVGESTDPNKPLYSYVKIEDVLAVVNPLLKRHKLILTGQVAKEPVTHVSKNFTTTEVLVDWTLEDTEGVEVVDDPIRKAIVLKETRTWRVPGCGSDESGKAIYKAMTGSRKQFYTIVFNLQFGDEPEEVQAKQKEEVSSGAVS